MKKILDRYYALLKLVLTILIGVLIVPVTMQIFARYIGFIPRYVWTEELARFCFIWIILIGAMIAMRENEHFTVDLLPTPKTNRGKAISLMFVDLMTFTLAVVFVAWGWPLVEFGLLQTSEMAELPMVFIYAAWPITGVTWILFLAERAANHIKLFRSDAS
ncbi:MAG: TRAP transporter small permease [Alphaproteobacteria bacterium]|nr:TRAP transporter small permease [Alphaproteobacteria bacterium]